MKSFNFKSIIQTYETKRKDLKKYQTQGKKEQEIHAIKVDTERSFHSFKNISEQQKENLKRILYEVLNTIPVEYCQGMHEVASVIVYYYFINELEDEDVEEIEADHDILEQARITVTNVLKEKYEPLLVDDFKLYRHYNNVFINMMEKRKKKLVPNETMKYMNATLSWFIRMAKNTDDIFTLTGYMLACPTSFPFLLLVRFYDEVEKRKEISKLDDDLYEQLLALEKEFLECESSLQKEKPIFGKKEVAIAGVIAAVCAGILFKSFKKGE